MTKAIGYVFAVVFGALLWPFRSVVRWWRSNDWHGRFCVMAVGFFPVFSIALFVGSVRQVQADGCPLVFDLNGNGSIDITGHVRTQDKLYTLYSLRDYVEFEMFPGRDPIKIDWVAPNTDAFLVDFRQGVPQTINGSHLFGTVDSLGDESYENGFQKLATLDADGNGVVSGEELTGLALWKDNGDARLASAEIVTLEEIGIVSIPVSPKTDLKAPYQLERQYTHAAIGTEGSILTEEIFVEDIWFMRISTPHPSDQWVMEKVRGLLGLFG